MKKRTKIVCTLGPSSESVEAITKLVMAGMNVARLNFSHGTHQSHQALLENTRSAARELSKAVPILQDLSGPRVQESTEHGFDQGATSVITEKDKKDLEFAIKNSVEYVALSYVGSAQDVKDARELLQSLDIDAKVIAKIERQIALDNFDEILAEADAIMIARGDLGNEVPIEKIPFIQEELVKKCNKIGKMVIVATEMMPSMVEESDPSRSDVTDVSMAVVEGADAVMLSNETAVGKHPVETIQYMERILQEAEKH